ncbi:MAG: 16S rRNA (guanine(966)-N(2))-methyltransferase RsmD [Gemmatimonadota bacterium]
MTRVIAGVARGRRLAVPPGTGTRPTSDRAREGLFSTLTAMRGTLAGAAVLDLYAGSGAVGLEALSRGAARALFVESDGRAARVIRENLKTVGLPGGTVLADKVARVLARGPAGVPVDRQQQFGSDPAGGARTEPLSNGYDIVVADPPYAAGDAEVTRMLALLAERGWLAAGAIAVVERATRSGTLAWPAGYAADRSRRYGEATFWYGLAAGIRPAGVS